MLDVRTMPPGAVIEVDGQRAEGVSPMRLPVPPGDHLIVAARDGFLETRDRVTVKSVGVTAADITLRPLMGLVLVESLPDGSDVMLDGAFRSKTPLVITDLPAGNHRIIIKKDGYEAKETALAINDRQPKLLSLELKSLLVAIKVTSTPDKAKVFVDGSYVGDSPQSLQNILQGKHKVRLELDGYEPYEQEVQVAGREEYSVNATLLEKYARIRLDTDPSGAEVFLNGESRGKAPVVLGKLHEGEYTIKVTKREFPEIERKVTLKKGEDLDLKIPFEKLVGILQVITIPAGAGVYVDGELKGTTVAVPNVAYSAPLFVRDIPQGSRLVKILKPGYAEVNSLISMKADQTVTLSNIQLKRLFLPDTEIVTKDGRTLRGVTNRVTANGSIHLETAPGIFVDVEADNIARKKSIAP